MFRSFLFVPTGFSKHDGVRVHFRYATERAVRRRRDITLSRSDIEQVLTRSRAIDHAFEQTETIITRATSFFEVARRRIQISHTGRRINRRT